MRNSTSERTRGREVANTCLVNLLELAARRNVPRDTLLHGLRLEGFDERAPFGRMAWDEYAVIFDRLEVALGGPAGLDALSRDVALTSRVVRTVAAHLLDLEQLIRFGLERLGPALFRQAGARVDVTSDRTLRAEMAIPRDLRGSIAWMRGNVATLEGYAELLGLPEVRITADVHAHGGVLRCALPPARTLQARAADALRARLDLLIFGAPDDAGAPTPLAADLPDDVANVALAEAASEIGQRLAALDDLEALASALRDHVTARFLSSRARLLVRRSPTAALEPVLPVDDDDAAPARATLVRPLYVLGRDVGRLEVDLDAAARPRELDLLLPFVALGVDRCLAAARDGDATPSPRAADRWRLTPRERSVLDLVLRGLANKEIAAELGCSVKNVESALSILFRKVGVANRTALVGEVLGVGRAAD